MLEWQPCDAWGEVESGPLVDRGQGWHGGGHLGEQIYFQQPSPAAVSISPSHQSSSSSSLSPNLHTEQGDIGTEEEEKKGRGLLQLLLIFVVPLMVMTIMLMRTALQCWFDVLKKIVIIWMKKEVACLFVTKMISFCIWMTKNMHCIKEHPKMYQQPELYPDRRSSPGLLPVGDIGPSIRKDNDNHNIDLRPCCSNGTHWGWCRRSLLRPGRHFKSCFRGNVMQRAKT